MPVSEANTPPEKVARVESFITAFNADRMLADRKHVVKLECGHLAYIGMARRSAVCPRCREMLRRSIADGSEDYESYRKGIKQDRMVWTADPCRQFNEPTDLSGNFTSDPPARRALGKPANHEGEG